ncbi:hypothetical protein CWB66_18750, partial [Pseudoalteromonas sp. S558]
KARLIYASIEGLLQVNSTQLALKIAARDRFIILSSGYLVLTVTKLFENSFLPSIVSVPD